MSGLTAVDIRIYQIHYRADQRTGLDPAFIPFDNTANLRPEWREYHVFREAHRAGLCAGDAIVGFVSWKFGLKTHVSGRDFVRFIARHPGHDVYFLNPRVERGRFANVWLQGEHHHPGIIGLAEEALRAAGTPMRLAELAHPPGMTLFCNFWAGTSRFWDRYMAFCEPVFAAIERGLPTDTMARLDARADRRIDACFRPFIMERLFTTLLAVDASIRWRRHPGRRRWLGGLGWRAA